MAKHKVLSTKKLEPSLIELAKESDIEIIEQEAIKVTPILSKEKWQEIFQIIESKKEFVVFTSSNAVSALKKYLNDYINPFQIDWKIFSLSGKTRQALEDTSLGTIIETADYGKDLAQKIIEQEVSEVAFFCGNKRREELPKMLTEAGIKVHEIVVYKTVETPLAAEKEIDGILFFSPSAVQSFFSMNQLKKDVVCFAVGTTTADSIQHFTNNNNKTIICEQPSQEMMLASVKNYFKTLITTNERPKE
jgi:uroporphyrinogen-III synthase